jgi:hypothetical protein
MNTLNSTDAATAPAFADSTGQESARGVGWATRILCRGRVPYLTDFAFCAGCGRYHVHRPPAGALIYRRARPCKPGQKYLVVVTATLPATVDTVTREVA